MHLEDVRTGMRLSGIAAETVEVTAAALLAPDLLEVTDRTEAGVFGEQVLGRSQEAVLRDVSAFGLTDRSTPARRARHLTELPAPCALVHPAR